MHSQSFTRRHALQSGLASALLALSPSIGRAADARPPRLLLRSSWQTVNIGDIGHTPGVLRLLSEHLPEAEVRLWPSKVDNGVAKMLAERFPKVSILQSGEAVKTAFAECDFLLHSSGPSLVAERDVRRWSEETGKPFGVYGITYSSKNPQTIELLSKARFVFFRDSVSLKFAQDVGIKAPLLALAPDGAFAVDLRNNKAADPFLEAHDLKPGKFLCCIPRLRYTPYWKIHMKEMTAEDHRKHRRSEEMKEHDHVPLRAAITAVVRETEMKVLICPEDQSQMAVGKEMLFDKLPADVQERVVLREKYWLTDEALSTYTRSAGLFGLEMHSPIMCIGSGVPAIVCRFDEQTSKGLMWRDIGLGDWLFDMDQEQEVERIVPTVLAMAKDPATARRTAAKAKAVVAERQQETMAVVAKELAAAQR